MTSLVNSYDILNPETGYSAVNELLRALTEVNEDERKATLTLRSTLKEDEGTDEFPLEVTEIRLELDDTGLLLLMGETDLGRVSGRLKLTNLVGKVGRVTIATEGALL